MMPGAAEAYRTFAIHSCDTETRYRRDESWETETFTLENWSDQAADTLMAELYRENLMDDEDRELYGKHKCGTLKLQPFYEKMMDDIGKILYIHGDL